MTEEKEENEYLKNDFRESNLTDTKTLSYKCKLIMVIGISLLVVAIITAIVIILLLKKNEDDNEKQNKIEGEEEEVEILDPIIIEPSSEYIYCIIWLHGLDNNPENYQNLFKFEVPFAKKENTKIILMRAPYQIMSFTQTNLTSWFDIFCISLDNYDCYNITDASKSRRMLEKIINQEAKKLRGNYQHIFVGGHSQGACISLYTAYSFKELLGGVLACSGILFKETEIVGDKTKLKVFMAHGFEDRAIPFSFHNDTIKRIVNFEGVKKYYYENHGHLISDYEKNDMGGFLNDSMADYNLDNILLCSLVKIILIFFIYY